jgi:hypothetical protein
MEHLMIHAAHQRDELQGAPRTVAVANVSVREAHPTASGEKHQWHTYCKPVMHRSSYINLAEIRRQ